MNSPLRFAIRPFERVDTESVVALWEAAGLTRPWNDPRADIERKLTVQPELFFVAIDAEGGSARPQNMDQPAEGAQPAEDKIIGSVMAGYDGHRGWLYYLASDPDRRGEGIGRALVAAAEAGLLAMGCPKVELMVRSGNQPALSFYDKIHYGSDDVIVRSKRLIED